MQIMPMIRGELYLVKRLTLALLRKEKKEFKSRLATSKKMAVETGVFYEPSKRKKTKVKN